jgi:3-oxoacyl-[acyl-carrier protein] reductase
VDLSGKRGLVTGASKGLGAVIARRLAEAGADVAIHFHTDEAGARETARAVEVAGHRARLFPGDLSRPEVAGHVLQAAADVWGGIDLLVNNAGAAPVQPWDAITPDEWQHTLAVDLSGPFYMLRAALPIMKRAGGGAAVNVGSVVSFNGGSFGPAYATAKAGLIGLTRSAARDWGRHGIRVNCVAPGPLDSPLARALPAEALAFMAAQTPLRRLGTFAEVAEVVAWLLSGDSAYVTGQTIVVDGGRVMN